MVVKHLTRTNGPCARSTNAFRNPCGDTTQWFERALAENRFEMWFQPIVDTTNGNILAHECLIRLSDDRLYNGGEIVDAARLRREIQSFDAYARRLAIHSAADESRTGLYFV